MIPPYINFHFVVTKLDGLFHRVLSIGMHTDAAARKHVENSGEKIISSHGTYGEAEVAAARANLATPVGDPAGTESIAHAALNAPGIPDAPATVADSVSIAEVAAAPAVA